MNDRPGDAERNRRSTLQSAVQRCEVDRARQLLAEGTDPNGLASFPLLHRAIAKGSLDLVRLLVDAGADLERPNHAGWAPLTRAHADEQHEIVDYLLSVGADPSSRNRHGFSELHLAARSGDPDRCARLLRSDADVNARAADGSTALMIAAQTCDTTVAEALLRVLLHHRADPDQADHEGWVPLASAAYEDAAHWDINNDRVIRVALLLHAGADPNAGTYPAMLASISQEGSCWNVIALLLRAGATPDRADEYGTTILHRATQTTTDGEFIARCAAVIRDVDRTDNSGATALDEALKEWSPEPDWNERLDPLLALIAAGADIFRVADRVPTWLIGHDGALRSDAPFEQASRFDELQRIVMATQAEFGNGHH